MKRFSLLSLTLLLLFVYACKEGDSVTVQPEPVMYEASELAALMRSMHDSVGVWKIEIEQDSTFELRLPETFDAIKSAEATSPEEINDVFYNMADVFLKRVEILASASPDKKIAEHNLLVSSCVNCHKLYCQGPIPKIEKLRIKE